MLYASSIKIDHRLPVKSVIREKQHPFNDRQCKSFVIELHTEW